MTKDTKALWASCQKYFQENVDAADYERLFSHVLLETFIVAKNTLVLQVPSSYISEEIEKKYLKELRTAIFNTFGKINLQWHDIVVKAEDEHKKDKGVRVESIIQTQAEAPAASSFDSQLNTRQTFRSFIEGDSNKLSMSIGLRIAEHPNGSQFNPMFIYGPPGCGKTHLVNAIGNRCKELYPQKRILYVSARVFQVQFTNAMKKGRINDFILFYQTIDMLIVDDVQEWMTATSTQDTFFHIFNHLFKNNRRIILVSDRTPVELEGMNKRLVSRFSCGLLAEMEKPNYQLCVDILKKKIARDDLRVPLDVIQYIASVADGSIRELEGVVNSLMAYSVVYNCNIDMKLVERVVKRAVKTDDTPLTVDDILDRVCRHYEVTPDAVKGRSRKRELVIPRQLTMFLAKKYTNIPATRIGKLIGSRDHSTVIHSIEQIEQRLKTEKDFVAAVEKIESSLKVKDDKKK